ncbi:MAG: hypothetical protein ACRDVZ_04110 [Jiangellaceae bacterium]
MTHQTGWHPVVDPDVPRSMPPPPGIPPLPPPRSSGRKRHSTMTLGLVAIAALLAGLVVGGGGVGVAWLASTDGDATSATHPAAAKQLPEELPRLKAFVEQARGLEFIEPVDVEILDDAGFERALWSPAMSTGTEAPGDYAATYAALGLTADADAYYEAEASGSTELITGFYDAVSDQLVVRGTEWTPMVEATVVHELTHALQDQHFDLIALETSVPLEDDSFLAIRGLIEGDATRIEYAYVGEQPREWQTQYENSFASTAPEGPYDPLAEELGWIPYGIGLDAVELIAAAGGNAAVDRAFRQPPTTSEQLLRAQEWLDGAPDVAVEATVTRPEPPNGFTAVDEGSLGAIVLAMLPLDLQEAVYDGSGLDGWQDDKYVTWNEGSGPCVALSVSIDDDAVTAAEQFFQPWSERTGGTIEPLRHPDGTRSLLLTSCTT